MREERGKLSGNREIKESVELWGMIAGDVTVVEGGKLYMRGAIYGNLIAAKGGRIHIFGNISGDLTVEEGAKVIHGGIVNGSITNRGGRLHIERSAKVLGKIKTKAGETSYEPGPPQG